MDESKPTGLFKGRGSSDDEKYDAAFARAVVRLRAQKKQLDTARAQVEERHQNFETLSGERRRALLRDSSPFVIVALAQDLLERSFAARFDSTARSLDLARRSSEVAEFLAEEELFPAAICADLRARSLAFLGNAFRISGDLRRSERALADAEVELRQGTGDRSLKADYLSLLATLREAQSRRDEAAAVLEHEIALRRLVGDEAGLGNALIERGRIACSKEGPTREACAFLRDGLSRAEERSRILVGIAALAEALARNDKGTEALELLRCGDLANLENARRFESRLNWIEGVAYHSIGDVGAADVRICGARLELLRDGAHVPAAIATIDLVAVRVDQGRLQRARELAQEAYEILVAKRLEKPALAALLTLRESLELEACSKQLPMAIARYLARFQHDRALRFERRDS